ncbi:MAG: hypothetical protein ABW022_24360 [Actinoplanes sp.]
MVGNLLVVVVASVAGLIVPAAAERPAVLRGVVLSTSDATVMPLKCSTTTRVGVYYTDPDRQGAPSGSGIVLSNPAAAVVGSTSGWRNGVTSVTYVIRLCGFGSTAWRYFGAAAPKCVEMCDIGEAAYVATRRFRQTVSGTWKAVSQRTSYLESGSGSDAVAVTRS